MLGVLSRSEDYDSHLSRVFSANHWCLHWRSKCLQERKPFPYDTHSHDRIPKTTPGMDRTQENEDESDLDLNLL